MVRMRVTITGYYDADPAHYDGETDPRAMAAIDLENLDPDPTAAAALIDDDVTIEIEPVERASCKATRPGGTDSRTGQVRHNVVQTPLVETERAALRDYAARMDDHAIGVLILSALWNLERTEAALAEAWAKLREIAEATRP